MNTDPTPSEGVPALGAKRAIERPASVPELNPEGYLAEEPETDTEVDRGFVPPDESVAEIEDDTDKPVMLEDTGAPTRRTPRVQQDATELEPESTEALAADAPTESGSAGSLYPGKLQYVRAPGWDSSGQIARVEVDNRKQPSPRPASAPLLEPASAPTMRSFRAEADADDPAMVPVEDKQHTRKIVAVR